MNSQSHQVAIHRPLHRRALEVLAVGDLEHPAFVSARELLAAEASLTSAGDKWNPADKSSVPEVFDLVVAFQSRPGSVPSSWVERARERNPLAGFVALLGTWCEGEYRTGAPLPFCERVFWYQFPAWWRDMHAARQAGRPTSWQRPLLAIDNEPSTIAPGLIVIDSPDADSADSLITACGSLGCNAMWTPTWRPRPLSSIPRAGIWVGGQLNADEEIRLGGFRKSLPVDAPLVALLDFPRRDRTARAKELGATGVLGKPWRLEQLAVCLE